MKKQSPTEKLKEVTAQLDFLEKEQEANPDRKLNKTITQLKVRKNTLEEVLGETNTMPF